MQLPIPDDWDGETYDCFQIQWPRSAKWLAVLAGLISSPSRGRFWDSRTGSIIAVQEMGRFIDSLNMPFVDCDGGSSSITPDIETVHQFASQEESDYFMSLCGYNPKAFKIEGGALYVKDFCGEWVAIGALTGSPDSGVYDVPDDIDLTETDVFPCGMANAVASLIEDLGGYIWDNSDNTFPLYLISKAQNHVNLDLNNQLTLLAVNQSLIMKGSVVITGGTGLIDLERSDVVESDMVPRLACALLPVMGTDGSVDSDSLWGACQAYFNQRFPNWESGNNVFIELYWQYILASIGRGNLVDVAKSGMLDDAGDCNCPDYDSLQIPNGSGWYLGEPVLVTESYDGTYNMKVSAKELALHDVYGVAFRLDWSGTVPNLKRMGSEVADIGAFDFSSFQDTSDQLQATASSTWFTCGDSTVWATIFTSAENVHLTGGDNFPDTVAVVSPIVPAGDVIAMAIWSDGSDARTVTCEYRLLHNIDSPSHA